MPSPQDFELALSNINSDFVYDAIDGFNFITTHIKNIKHTGITSLRIKAPILTL